MNRITIFFLLLCCFLPISAKNSKDFFSQVTNQRGTSIIVGDSSIFSVWLYSIYPFSDIKCANANIKIRGCHVRKVYQTKGQQQSIRYINGIPYYSTLWAQYIVGGEAKGNYNFPSLSFSAILYQQQESQPNQLDPFGFFTQPTYKKLKRNCIGAQLNFKIISAPLKTTEELIKSGKSII